MKKILSLIFSCLFLTSAYTQNLVANNYAFVNTSIMASEDKVLSKNNPVALNNKKDALAYTKHAEAQIKQKKYDLALLNYIAAVDLDPDNLDAVFNRGALKIIIGDYEGSLGDMTRIIKENPADTDAYYNRATAKMSLNDLKGAILDYDAVINLDPEYTAAYYFRGLMKFELKDKQGACADWQKAAKFDSRAAKLLKKYSK